MEWRGAAYPGRVTWRIGLVGVAIAAVAGACSVGGDDGTEATRVAVEESCSVLSVTKPAGILRAGDPVSLLVSAELLKGSVAGEPADVSLHINRAEPSLVDEVEREVSTLPGVSVVRSWTQQEVYDEFLVLFADAPELLDTVYLELMPPRIDLEAADDSALAEIGDRFDFDDPRVESILDNRLDARSVGFAVGELAKAFGSERTELEILGIPEVVSSLGDVFLIAGIDPVDSDLPTARAGAEALVEFARANCELNLDG